MTHPYQSPSSNLQHETDEFTKVRFFALKGRIGRVRFYVYPSALAFMIAMFAGFILAAAGRATNEPPWINIILSIPILLIFIVYTVRRLQDMDAPLWLAALLLVPVVNFFFVLYLQFAKGSPGANQHGAPPEPNTTGLVVAACILGVLSAIMIAGVLMALMLPFFMVR